MIGSGLSRQALQVVGRRPLIQGFLLWVVMGRDCARLDRLVDREARKVIMMKLERSTVKKS